MSRWASASSSSDLIDPSRPAEAMRLLASLGDGRSFDDPQGLVFTVDGDERRHRGNSSS